MSERAQGNGAVPEVGIVVVTHGSYGTALIDAARGIVGNFPDVTPISIESADGQETVRKKIAAAVEKTDRGAGVLLCGDLCGSTPGNTCVAVARAAREHGERVGVVFGVSLAMLMKLAVSDRRSTTPAKLAELCAETARKSVLIPGLPPEGV